MTTGRCNFFTDMFGPRAGLLFLLHAVFDETECKMHGTNLAPELASREVNEWTDGCTRTVLAPRIGHAVRFMM